MGACVCMHLWLCGPLHSGVSVQKTIIFQTLRAQCCLWYFSKVHLLFPYSLLHSGALFLDPGWAWGLCCFLFYLIKKIWWKQPLPPLFLVPTSPLLFREGEALPWVSSLGHQVSAGLDVSSPTEALPGSPDRGRGSSVRPQSQRQSLLQLLGDPYEDQAAHMLLMRLEG